MRYLRCDILFGSSAPYGRAIAVEFERSGVPTRAVWTDSYVIDPTLLPKAVVDDLMAIGGRSPEDCTELWIVGDLETVLSAGADPAIPTHAIVTGLGEGIPSWARGVLACFDSVACVTEADRDRLATATELDIEHRAVEPIPDDPPDRPVVSRARAGWWTRLLRRLGLR